MIKRLLFVGALVATMLCPLVPAMAGEKTTVTKLKSSHSSMLSAVASNAAAASRTVTIDTTAAGTGYSKLRLGIQLTRSAATVVTAQFTCAYFATYYRKTTRSCSSGTCSVYEHTETNAQTTSLNFELEYDVKGCESVQVVLGATGGGASDLFTTEAVLIAGE